MRLVLINDSKDSSLASVISARTLGAIPALFTRESKRPNLSRTALSIAERDSELEISPRTGKNS